MVEVREISSKAEWENFVGNYPGSNFLQSWNWGEVHLRMGHTIYRKGFFIKNKVFGILLMIVEKAKRTTYLTVPGGPLIDWKNKKLVSKFRDELIETARKENCSFVRVRPQLLNTEDNNKLFIDLGFRKAPMHLHVQLTTRLDLQKSENELMANMRKTTRYEIKNAVKLGIKVEKSNAVEDIDKFYKLQLETARRQAFVPFSHEYFALQYEVFSKDKQIELYSAIYEGKVLAQGLIIFYGQEADYHYGASSEEGRKYPGAYLMLWEAILEAKRRGKRYFDLWGIAPENDKRHRFYGISLFKRGFGGDIYEYLPAKDLVLDWPRYAINWIIEEIREKLRGL